jgi:hypothetical protein
VKKPYRKPLSFGIPAAMVLLLVFLIGMGHLGFLSERMNLIFAKNEAVATPEKVLPVNPTLIESPIFPVSRGAPDEKDAAEAAALVETAKPPVSLSSPGGKEPKMGLTTVEKEETLYSVLRRQYGQANTTLLDYVLLANPEISDPHRVNPGTRVRIPALSEDSLVQPSPGGDFRIHLATFAQKNLAEKFRTPKTLVGRALQIEKRSVSTLETWYRVFAVGYNSEEEALKAATGLRKTGVLALFPLPS